jgi:hypothetical protein
VFAPAAGDQAPEKRKGRPIPHLRCEGLVKPDGPVPERRLCCLPVPFPDPVTKLREEADAMHPLETLLLLALRVIGRPFAWPYRTRSEPRGRSLTCRRLIPRCRFVRSASARGLSRRIRGDSLHQPHEQESADKHRDTDQNKIGVHGIVHVSPPSVLVCECRLF